MSLKKTLLFIAFILIVDQISKVYIKTNFMLSESEYVFDWFHIHFVENDGMAWGTKISDFVSFISDRTAKLILTLFRIVAVTGIGFWLHRSIKNKQSKTLIIAVALIFAGALGNIIDSMFYGVLFGESYLTVAKFLPVEGGYDSLFHGKVVDMFYFPIWSGVLPEWIPFFGGKIFSFFDPVFNVADVAISTGIGILLFFNKKIFSKTDKDLKTDVMSEELHNNLV
ncbi:lipoprotein signal peptidase [Ichthyenterobacterium sp. W332]|uniref:Lipoprotein signal peptidase n=1 Tax=Microcosmobacter mediterraneus TaxID=3075607 RepID=A0ABU2YKD5_9FLAO|nr:lipoprotein signal peptidase [Ichthyenterobacterium sp. W332]MDT0558149.1 lipoprotein signal peptidase [Ichthyenterobacterium sp. W332]